MRGLIIAAGKGSRIAALGPCKPLIPLLGRAILEWVMGAAHRGGIDEFYVVTGYQSTAMVAFLEQLARKWDVPITPIYNEEWEHENGLSVLKARAVLDGPFTLFMADHIFQPETLLALHAAPLADGQVQLAVDYRLTANPFVDVDDVTRVQVVDGRIVDIGKRIPACNAYDTGMFRCSPALFDAVESSIADAGDYTLSGAMRVLCRQGNARAFDMGDHWWIDVDDPGAFQKAEEILATDPLYRMLT